MSRRSRVRASSSVLRDSTERSVEEDQFAVACEGKTFLEEASPESKMIFSGCNVEKLIIKTNKIFNSKTKTNKLHETKFILNLIYYTQQIHSEKFIRTKRIGIPIFSRLYRKKTFLEEASQELKMETTAHDTLISIIQKQVQKENQRDIWKNSPYKDLVKLQSNNVGNVGEEFINTICKLTNIPANCDGSKTKHIGGGEGDGTIMGIPVEIKTAHQGSTYPSFQHELGEVPWKGSRYMIFVDISPECIYLTIFANFDEETYKSKKKLVLFPTKSVTWRKEKGAFKLDTNVKLNEQSIEKGYSIKITPTTPNEYIASFIQRMII